MNTPTAVPLVILGVPFHPYTNRETCDWCVEYIKNRTPGYVATPNLDFVMQAGRDPELSRILAQSSLVIPDGMPIVWLSGRLGPKLPERVAGSDLILRLSEAAARESFSVFHLGGAPGVPEKAGEVLKEKFPGFVLAGAYSPPKAELLEMDQNEILKRLAQSKPDILYVAFGAPKQEKWINLHYRDWDIPLALGLGGSLDFLAGTQKRAPSWMQKSGTEWIWRLGTNPKRLWKRYSANFRFLFEALSQIKSIRRLEDQPAAADVPTDPDGNPDPRFVRIPWMELTTQERTRDFIMDTEKAIKGQHAVLDFSGFTWLSSLEMGALVVLGRNAKIRGQHILRTGGCTRLNEWMRFNLLDPLIEPFDPAVDWDRRLKEREAIRVSEGSGKNPLSVPNIFGSPKTRKKTIEFTEKKACTLYPPEELSALTLNEWKQAVLPPLNDLPSETRAIWVDAGDLRFLDSAGLGFLMHLKKLAQEKRREFGVQNLHGAPLTTVKLARVEKLLLPRNPTSPEAL
jgi:N-acetylglucosaminyldiphosphoundecaprenol N-acetyl-beta-D-mannosaminyltransferase